LVFQAAAAQQITGLRGQPFDFYVKVWHKEPTDDTLKGVPLFFIIHDLTKEFDMKSYQNLQRKRSSISGRIVVGIDPGKDKHQVVVLDGGGLPMGSTFTITTDSNGFRETLWRQLSQRVGDLNPRRIVFAIENACNLWQTLAWYLHRLGWQVVLVSPLSTKHGRVTATNDFSKTDPKDALMIGSNAQQGYYSPYQCHDDAAEAMHRLGITYSKLRKDYVQQRNRLRSTLDFYFPEFPRIVSLDSQTARYLLRHYPLPQDYAGLDVETLSEQVSRVSYRQFGRETVRQLQEAARTTIGIPCRAAESQAIRLEIGCWLDRLDQVEQQMKQVITQLRALASQLPQFETLTGLKGISDTLAALFLAELRDPAGFSHYKHVEKLAGYNLILADSGRSSGPRRISPIGNKRLRWVLYRMAEETVRYVPEVRIKYLRRQIKKGCYRQNVVAAIPTLLKLITALCKRNEPYQARDSSQTLLDQLEAEYEIVKARRKRAKRRR